MRIIIYTGKGGVGKTSIAAATAVKMSKQGLRTLIMSTDAAHSLSDSFGIQLSNEPTPLYSNLWGLEVDCQYETEKHWGEVKDWMTDVLEWAKLDDISSEEMLVFPGMEELFSLMRLDEFASNDKYDAIVVDCAPTGETLRLLSYPNMVQWWLKKIFPIEKMLVKLARPFSKIVTGGLELPSDKIMNLLEITAEKLSKLQLLMTDTEITSVRLVVNPEKMVIAEARRAYTYLSLFGFNTDAVVINRIMPDEASTGYWSHWRDIHAKYLEEIETSFNPLPILRVPLMQLEVEGLDMLEKIGELAFCNASASDILYKGKTQEVRKEADNYYLDIYMPFVKKDALDMTQNADELTIQVGQYKRKIILPRLLLGKTIVSAKFVEERLEICFVKKETEGIEEV